MKPDRQTVITTLYSLAMTMAAVTVIWAAAEGAVWATVFALCTVLLLCLRLLDQQQPCARCEAAKKAAEASKEGNA